MKAQLIQIQPLAPPMGTAVELDKVVQNDLSALGQPSNFPIEW